MAYEPTNWKSGDVVTAAKLNKIEQGIYGSVFIVHLTEGQEGTVADATIQEIYDAAITGCLVRATYFNGVPIDPDEVFYGDSSLFLSTMGYNPEVGYGAVFVGVNQSMQLYVLTLAAENMNDYPTVIEGNG